METKATATIFAVACMAAAAAAATDLEPRNYDGRIAERLVNTMQKAHVLQRVADDEISRRAWTNLVSYYDFDHSVFLQEDLDRLSWRMDSIDDELKSGNVDFGFEVYNLYVRRLDERLAFATNLLMTAEFDFSTNETYRVRRKDAPWPKTVAEAEDHWRRRMKNEVATDPLSGLRRGFRTLATQAQNDAQIMESALVQTCDMMGQAFGNFVSTDVLPRRWTEESAASSLPMPPSASASGAFRCRRGGRLPRPPSVRKKASGMVRALIGRAPVCSMPMVTYSGTWAIPCMATIPSARLTCIPTCISASFRNSGKTVCMNMNTQPVPGCLPQCG